LDDLDSSIYHRKQGKDGEQFHSVAGKTTCPICEVTTRLGQDTNLIASLQPEAELINIPINKLQR